MIFKIEGHSMSPYLSDGDILLIDKNTSQLEIGDLALIDFPQKQKKVIHRYLSSGFKGDSNKRYDNEIHLSYRLLGVVKGRMVSDLRPLDKRYGRLLMLWSELNHSCFPVFHRISQLMIQALGRLARKKELKVRSSDET